VARPPAPVSYATVHSLPRFAQHAVTEGILRQTDTTFVALKTKCRSWLKCGRWLDLCIITYGASIFICSSIFLPILLWEGSWGQQPYEDSL